MYIHVHVTLNMVKRYRIQKFYMEIKKGEKSGQVKGNKRNVNNKHIYININDLKGDEKKYEKQIRKLTLVKVDV